MTKEMNEFEEDIDSSSESQDCYSVLDKLSSSDSECIDATAAAWIAAGGDAEGVAWMWKTLQERVRELS